MDSRPVKAPPIKVESVIPKRRQDLLRWDGWGYQDSQFFVQNAATDKAIVSFSGNRYPISGHLLPEFKTLMQEYVDVPFDNVPKPREAPKTFPEPVLNEAFMKALAEISSVTFSVDGMDRMFRAHGHTLRDIYTLRTGMFERIPDVVVWPSCHGDVVRLVRLACEHNVVLIPVGGATNVTGALSCSPKERRMIISLDMTQMNRILSLDKENLIARCEAGIIGQDLQRSLEKKGFTMGHEPDSIEFSSLGGWVATRASGMKKTVYGNIEDLVVHVTLVTPQGVIRRNAAVSRVSAGPDLHQMIMGSEGTLGVITEVVIKIRPLPEVERYGSIAFPDFFSGVRCLRQVAKERLRVSSIRLMDNTQFRLGKGLSPAAGWLKSVKDYLAKRYVTAWKGFDMTQMTVATLLVEGYTEKEVELLSSRVFSIAASFGGFSAGEENGRRGYTMTFSIAYIRDFCLDYGVFAESFETSVPWDRVLHLCHNVKKRVEADCGKRPFILEHVTSCRVTQCYDDCACVYFYMGITIDKQFQGDPCAVYEELEHSARNEILASGGTISHHHGVGKIRQHWLPETITPTGVAALKAVKKELDPHNIFAAGNLYTMDSPPEDDSSQTKAKL